MPVYSYSYQPAQSSFLGRSDRSRQTPFLTQCAQLLALSPKRKFKIMMTMASFSCVRPVALPRASAGTLAPSACSTQVPRGAKPGPAFGTATRKSVCRPLLTRHRTVIAASNDVDFQGLEEADGAPGSDYTAVFALAAFAAQYFNQFTVDISFLLKAFAVFSLVNAAAAVVFNESAYDKVGTIMAPAVLASRVVLQQVDTLTLVVGAVGWFLSYELPGLPFYGWIATLAAAIYYGYGTQWVVAAYAFGTLTRVLNGLDNGSDKKMPVVSVPVLAVSAFAWFQGYKSLWVCSLAVGEVARSFYTLARRVKGSEPRGLTQHSG